MRGNYGGGVYLTPQSIPRLSPARSSSFAAASRLLTCSDFNCGAMRSAYCTLRSMASGKTKANAAAAVRRNVVATVSRPAVPTVVVPRAAAQHTTIIRLT